MICKFQGEFRFLSNFIGGVEQKYQAAKCLHKLDAEKILKMSAVEAKRASRKIEIRPDWDSIKLEVMENLVTEKFSNEPFKSQLIATGDQDLIEGNTWNDTFWGVCRGVGDNNLGKILMKVRNKLK